MDSAVLKKRFPWLIFAEGVHFLHNPIVVTSIIILHKTNILIATKLQLVYFNVYYTTQLHIEGLANL